jgi:26S proteasome regulatory subunit N6
VRALIDDVSQIDGGTTTVIELCLENITWAEAEKRTFLRLHLQNVLAESYFQLSEHHEALKVIKTLLREVKKLDDKMLLVSIFLLESKIQHSLQHLPRARVCDYC